MSAAVRNFLSCCVIQWLCIPDHNNMVSNRTSKSKYSTRNSTREHEYTSRNKAIAKQGLKSFRLWLLDTLMILYLIASHFGRMGLCAFRQLLVLLCHISQPVCSPYRTSHKSTLRLLGDLALRREPDSRSTERSVSDSIWLDIFIHNYHPTQSNCRAFH